MSGDATSSRRAALQARRVAGDWRATVRSDGRTVGEIHDSIDDSIKRAKLCLDQLEWRQRSTRRPGDLARRRATRGNRQGSAVHATSGVFRRAERPLIACDTVALVDDDPLTALVNWLRPTWHADAACKEHPELSWFPGLGDDTRRQKTICSGCLVRTECSEAAGDAGDRLVGIWAGCSGKERRRRRDQRAATNTALRTIDGAAFTTPIEYAKALGITVDLVHRRARNGSIPGARQIGRRWLIPIAELSSTGSAPAA